MCCQPDHDLQGIVAAMEGVKLSSDTTIEGTDWARA
jgi:hypothetical protein